MQIDREGLKPNTLSKILTANVESVKRIFGSDFSIKPEGVIDNIVTAVGLMERDLENQLLFVIKQFDPETAEGEYQDYLYERVGLYRINSTLTTFVLTVHGDPLTEVGAEDIVIKNSDSNDIFYNKSEFTFNSDGTADVEFQSIVEGALDVDTCTEFATLTAPESVRGVDFSSVKNIQIGVNREGDAEFRERFHALKTSNKKCSRNAILENLSKFTDGMEYISVRDCNTDETIPAGSIRITARPTVSDAEFGKLILDNVIAGVNFIGNTEVSVPLSNGQLWEVKFQKAEAVPVDLYIKTKLRSAYYENSVFHNVRNNILAYLEEHVFGLKATIWATEFIVPTLDIDGVDAVTEILIKRHDSQTFTDSISLDLDEYPQITYESISLTK